MNCIIMRIFENLFRFRGSPLVSCEEIKIVSIDFNEIRDDYFYSLHSFLGKLVVQTLIQNKRLNDFDLFY